MKKVISVLVVAACLLGLAGVASALGVGDALPVVKMESFNDKGEVTNATLKGNNTVLLFFNTSCSICRGELQDVMKVHAAKKNFEVVLVNIDMNYEKRLPGYIDAMKITVPVVTDPEFNFARSFGLSSTPALVVVDKEVKVKAIKKGYSGKMEELVALLKDL